MAECNVQFGEVTEIDRIPCIIFECDKITEIIVYPNERMLARLKIQGEAGGWLKFETSYDLTFEYSEEEMELTTSSWSVERGDVILTNITAKSEGDFFITTKMNGKETGRVKVVSKQRGKDVFTEAENTRLVQENEYIKPFADQGTHSEYDENYCMQAAERGLSELLNNTTDFYSVERGTHAQVSGISFSGLTAIDRGNAIKSSGFVKTSWSYNKYAINHTEREQINNSKDEAEARANYLTVRYSIITLSDEDKQAFYDSFISDIKDKPGFHVYYFSITNGFHTLLLVIDYRDPCSAEYKIYDQHGLTSSQGVLEEIGEGVRKQTSWTFANTCLNRYRRKSTQHWDSTETQLWKIQKK
ncbi:hypothetical protein D1816_08595 [Aquimarina sp. AD10]|uniref:hypothetical protein n=1 Tax=Aquimarina TaxID=290174 RepID=UPI000E4A4498|nr:MULTISPECIES: hypothetical protein [Aquimarina]AXT60405.1 hypothetical protein D1816_08595 [Aquimarina sp. AD10]RKN01160.1 hypothetical protein D7033_04890 [Aquimarina sp. AD10]